MKNISTSIAALSLLLMLALGCSLGSLTGSDDSGSSDSSGSSESSDGSSSTSDGGGGELVKVGIPECDEFATYINERAETIGEDSYVVRAVVEMYKQRIFNGLKESVEKMDDEEKARTAEECKKAMENVKKQMGDKE